MFQIYSKRASFVTWNRNAQIGAPSNRQRHIWIFPVLYPFLRRFRRNTPTEVFSTMSTEPLPCFLCAITYEVMENPVIDREGNTYEHEAILKWLERHSTSPITRNPLSVIELVPNRALKEAIETAAAEEMPLGRSHDEKTEVYTPRSLKRKTNVKPRNNHRSLWIVCISDDKRK